MDVRNQEREGDGETKKGSRRGIAGGARTKGDKGKKQENIAFSKRGCLKKVRHSHSRKPKLGRRTPNLSQKEITLKYDHESQQNLVGERAIGTETRGRAPGVPPAELLDPSCGSHPWKNRRENAPCGGPAGGMCKG